MAISNTGIEKENLDKYPDPDSEWLFGCLMNCNRKCTTLPALRTSQGATLVQA